MLIIMEEPTPHGEARTHEYLEWDGMRRRCYNPRCSAWPLYGGRGVEMAPGWKESFEVFLADVGTRPSADHRLKRTDPDGHYEPNNCSWAEREVPTISIDVDIDIDLGGLL